MSRQGLPTDNRWYPRVSPWVDDWEGRAMASRAHPLGAHTDEAYRAYLHYYQPRTRCRITYPALQQQPHVASTQDTYPRHRDQQAAGAVSYL
jgi:hypothetical protein